VSSGDRRIQLRRADRSDFRRGTSALFFEANAGGAVRSRTSARSEPKPPDFVPLSFSWLEKGCMQEVTSPAIALKKRNDSMPARGLAAFVVSFPLPGWQKLTLAFLGIFLGSAVSVSQPCPLKVVIDRVLSPSQHSRVPLLSAWLDHATLTPKEIIYGGCAASILMALLSGALSYCFTRLLGDATQRFVFSLQQLLFAHV